MKHGLISVGGWAAVACWIVSLVVAASVGSQEPTHRQAAWIGFFGLAVLVLTAI